MEKTLMEANCLSGDSIKIDRVTGYERGEEYVVYQVSTFRLRGKKDRVWWVMFSHKNLDLAIGDFLERQRGMIKKEEPQNP